MTSVFPANPFLALTSGARSILLCSWLSYSSEERYLMPRLGQTLTGILYGIAIGQTWRYFKNYRQDPLYLKIFGGLYRTIRRYHTIRVLLADSLSTASESLVDSGIRSWYVSSSSYLNAKRNREWVQPIAFIHFLCTASMARKREKENPGRSDLRFLKRRKATFDIDTTGYDLHNLPALQALILTSTFKTSVSGTGDIIYVKINGALSSIFVPLSRVSQTVAVVSRVLCDAVICVMLAYYLNRGRSSVSRGVKRFRSTDQAFFRLIIFSINIGLVTMIFSLASMITWQTALPFTFLWVIFYGPISLIYFNSVLVSLNARKGLRQKFNNVNNRTRSATTFMLDALDAIDAPAAQPDGEVIILSSMDKQQAQESQSEDIARESV
ncbi:hypothetical protein M422DRAFT_64191 [Sphaerobolus stellatus SS14]|nr:hypothetical protein M422DRAFT_64191 [Sphaerobolus stellatus SS14]